MTNSFNNLTHAKRRMWLLLNSFISLTPKECRDTNHIRFVLKGEYTLVFDSFCKSKCLCVYRCRDGCVSVYVCVSVCVCVQQKSACVCMLICVSVYVCACVCMYWTMCRWKDPYCLNWGHRQMSLVHHQVHWFVY